MHSSFYLRKGICIYPFLCLRYMHIWKSTHGVELLFIYDTILQISSHKINAVFIPLTNQSSCTPCRNLRKNVSAKLLINLCLALLGLYVTYVISTLSTGVPVLCGLISALMHYFFLAVFFWMAAEAIHLHRKLVTVYKPDIKSYIAITMAICWGRLYMHTWKGVKLDNENDPTFHIVCTSCAVVPGFIVTFSLAPHHQYYSHAPL